MLRQRPSPALGTCIAAVPCQAVVGTLIARCHPRTGLRHVFTVLSVNGAVNFIAAKPDFGKHNDVDISRAGLGSSDGIGRDVLKLCVGGIIMHADASVLVNGCCVVTASKIRASCYTSQQRNTQDQAHLGNGDKVR